MKNYDQELTALAERLTAVALDECNPANWPGAASDGTLPPASDLTAAERGDLVWSKKSAAGTLGLLQKVHSLIGAHNPATTDRKALAAVADEKEQEKLIADIQKDLEKLYEPGGALYGMERRNDVFSKKH